MRKELYLLLFFLLIFASCKQVYHPTLDTLSGQLVVDAKITNDPSQNMVHLSRTRDFYSTSSVLEVTGATVTLVKVGGASIKGNEYAPGYYKFVSLPVSGNQYFLRIIIGNDVFESKAVTMPPLPTITNFYTTDLETTVLYNSANGTHVTYLRQSRDINADMPSTDSLSFYRFDIRSLIEWTYDSNPSKPGIVPTCYGWNSYQDKEFFQLVGLKDVSIPGQIIKHRLLNLTYDSISAAHKDTLQIKGWILFIEQYGTSKDSYDFHQQLNSQFAASGSFFDPIQTQVYGNILCKTDPLQTAYGYFDLNSYQQYRYFLILTKPPGVISLRQLHRFPDIPDNGQIYGIAGEDPIKPNWWEE